MQLTSSIPPRRPPSWGLYGIIALCAMLFASTIVRFNLSVGTSSSPVREVAGPTSSLAPDYGILGTGRRPLVIVSGTTEQLPTADYISTVGGLTTNGTAASSGDIESTTATISTTFNTQGAIVRTGVITPSAFTGVQQDDYNPPGLSTASEIDITVNSNTTLTGITAQATGFILTIRNMGANVITFSNESTSSLAANRFNFGASQLIGSGSTLVLRYSGSDWRTIAWTPGVTANFNNITPTGVSQITQLRYVVTLSATTGTSDNIANTNNIYRYTGTGGNATYTGFASGSDGRFLIVQNQNGSGRTLTLANQNAGSTASNQLLCFGSTDITLSDGGAATFMYNTARGLWIMTSLSTNTVGGAIQFTSSQNRGTITLSGGTGTATVQTGTVCTCTDTTANASVQCAVTSTTLTATGTGTDVIAYLCF